MDGLSDFDQFKAAVAVLSDALASAEDYDDVAAHLEKVEFCELFDTDFTVFRQNLLTALEDGLTVAFFPLGRAVEECVDDE